MLPTEFKDEVVWQVLQRGHVAREVAARLDIAAHMLYRPVNAIRPSEAEQQDDDLLETTREYLKRRAELSRV